VLVWTFVVAQCIGVTVILASFARIDLIAGARVGAAVTEDITVITVAFVLANPRIDAVAV
jgi:hypothetical protein